LSSLAIGSVLLAFTRGAQNIPVDQLTLHSLMLAAMFVRMESPIISPEIRTQRSPSRTNNASPLVAPAYPAFPAVEPSRLGNREYRNAFVSDLSKWGATLLDLACRVRIALFLVKSLVANPVEVGRKLSSRALCSDDTRIVENHHRRIRADDTAGVTLSRFTCQDAGYEPCSEKLFFG
jgi:hypothetical protein